jgi:hypothetical protein
MEHSWTIRETNTHQDHVIAHVVGATVAAYFTANEAAYLLLDIGFVWIVYLDGEMGLVPQSMAIVEMEVDEETRTQLKADLLLLHDAAADENALKRFSKVPDGCLIVEVEFQERLDERRLLITGEEVSLSVEASLTNREFRFNKI